MPPPPSPGARQLWEGRKDVGGSGDIVGVGPTLSAEKTWCHKRGRGRGDTEQWRSGRVWADAAADHTALPDPAAVALGTVSCRPLRSSYLENT